MKPMISAAALAAALLAAPSAHAATIVNFDSFSAPEGTASGTDGLGNAWTVAQSGAVWIFTYKGTYNSGFAFPSASDFEVSIIPTAVTISGAAVGVDSGPWSPTFNAATASVGFAGPAVRAGQGFLFAVDVVGIQSSPGFTASWSTTVPEPSTWAMTLLGFAGLGFAGYRASQRTAVTRA